MQRKADRCDVAVIWKKYGVVGQQCRWLSQIVLKEESSKDVELAAGLWSQEILHNVYTGGKVNTRGATSVLILSRHRFHTPGARVLYCN